MMTSRVLSGRSALLGDFVTLTEYAADIDTACASQVLDMCSGSIWPTTSAPRRIAETEKYAHVTFFNGGREAPFAGEDRTLIPSPQVRPMT